MIKLLILLLLVEYRSGTGKKVNCLLFHTHFELRERDLDTFSGKPFGNPGIDGVPDIIGKVVHFRPDIQYKFQVSTLSEMIHLYCARTIPKYFSAI